VNEAPDRRDGRTSLVSRWLAALVLAALLVAAARLSWLVFTDRLSS